MAQEAKKALIPDYHLEHLKFAMDFVGNFMKHLKEERSMEWEPRAEGDFYDFSSL